MIDFSTRTRTKPDKAGQTSADKADGHGHPSKGCPGLSDVRLCPDVRGRLRIDGTTTRIEWGFAPPPAAHILNASTRRHLSGAPKSGAGLAIAGAGHIFVRRAVLRQLTPRERGRIAQALWWDAWRRERPPITLVRLACLERPLPAEPDGKEIPQRRFEPSFVVARLIQDRDFRANG